MAFGGKGGGAPVPAFRLPEGLTGAASDIAMRNVRRSGRVVTAASESSALRTAWLRHGPDSFEQVRDDWGWRVLEMLGW